LELSFQWSLQLPRKTPIRCTITPPEALLYPHSVVLSIPSAAALAPCALTHLRYAFTI
jgi:hypothetical protein